MNNLKDLDEKNIMKEKLKSAQEAHSKHPYLSPRGAAQVEELKTRFTRPSPPRQEEMIQARPGAHKTGEL